MQRRRFRREFKVEAVKFVGERQVSVAQAGTTVRAFEAASLSAIRFMI